ncbi:MAG TPA: ankyrin repeat domain-containing protein [Opitutaceae bacterium]|nr:ankyrin repeat domain-containing protein [Opitutaceae bacterium]
MNTKLMNRWLIYVAGVALATGGLHAQSDPASALQQYMADLHRSPNDTALREKVITFVRGMNPAPTLPEDAERYMARGAAAFKNAKTAEDFKDAVTEFEKATLAAPWLADAYNNLGVAQEKVGLFGPAMQSFKLYLLAAPDAPDAKEKRTLIYELEYSRDKAESKVAATKTLFEAFGLDILSSGFANLKQKNVSINDVRLALDHGADVNSVAAEKWGLTALKCAIYSGQDDVLQLLLDHGADVREGRPLIDAVAFEFDATTIKLLIDKGANVNAKRDDGSTALMKAAQYAELDVVRLLLKKGADIRAKDNNGRTALMLIRNQGGNGFWNNNRKAQFERDKPEVIRILEEAEAKSR